MPSSLVGSIAVLALGTGLEWLARRAAGGAAKAVTNALVTRPKAPVRRAASTPAVDASAVSIDEVVYIRQVRLRR